MQEREKIITFYPVKEFVIFPDYDLTQVKEFHLRRLCPKLKVVS